MLSAAHRTERVPILDIRMFGTVGLIRVALIPVLERRPPTVFRSRQVSPSPEDIVGWRVIG